MILQKKVTTVLTIIIVLLITVVIIQQNRIKNKNSDLAVVNHNNKALNDTLRLTRDQLGRETASKLTFIGTKKQLEESLKKEKELTEILKKNKRTTAALVYKYDTKLDTTLLVIKDTTSPSNFTATLKDKWIEGEFRYLDDSLHINNLLVKNSLSIRFDKEKEGIRAYVTNNNPYATATSLSSFYKTEQQKRKNGKFLLGAIAGTVVTWLIVR